ncbi:MAG TPA: hypothetical protein VEI83_11200 [Acidimicrobiales bacterium]|nr:hypothetical protein [Acidimicrobiales bacterium]
MGERGAIIISWGNQRAGITGTKGMEVFGESLAFYDELAKEGRITSYRVFASTMRMHGSLVIEGDMTELARIATSTEATRLLAKAAAVVDDIELDLCVGGSVDEVTGYYTRAIEAIGELGLD